MTGHLLRKGQEFFGGYEKPTKIMKIMVHKIMNVWEGIGGKEIEFQWI